jgi:hypothetical protein
MNPFHFLVNSVDRKFDKVFAFFFIFFHSSRTHANLLLAIYNQIIINSIIESNKVILTQYIVKK